MTTTTFKTLIGTIPKPSRFVLGFALTGRQDGIGDFSIVAPRISICKKAGKLLMPGMPINEKLIEAVVITRRSVIKREKPTS